MKGTRIRRIITATLLLAVWGMGGMVVAEDTLPHPGDVIDKTNIASYEQYFPDFFREAFTTGYGMIAPLSVTIQAATDCSPPKVFLAATAKNKGKYGLDTEGYITGGAWEEISGYPFPDISAADPEFTEKLMWNYDYRYQFDEARAFFLNQEKRLGGSVGASIVDSYQVMYQSRMFEDPKPLYKTSNGYRNTHLIRNLLPPVQRNFITLMIRYTDQRATDTTYLYLPSMRRVLRGEAGERSTPIMSSTQAPDDFSGFNGRIPEFSYQLVGERKVVGQVEGRQNYTYWKDKTDLEYIGMDPDGWQVREAYVIDAMSKNEKYPQSRKRLWIDKETMTCLYACAYDRAGKLWKIWQIRSQRFKNNARNGGEDYVCMTGMLGIDLQLGYATQMMADWTMNGVGLTENDFSISTLRKLGR